MTKQTNKYDQRHKFVLDHILRRTPLERWSGGFNTSGDVDDAYFYGCEYSTRSIDDKTALQGLKLAEWLNNDQATMSMTATISDTSVGTDIQLNTSLFLDLLDQPIDKIKIFYKSVNYADPNQMTGYLYTKLKVLGHEIPVCIKMPMFQGIGMVNNRLVQRLLKKNKELHPGRMPEIEYNESTSDDDDCTQRTIDLTLKIQKILA